MSDAFRDGLADLLAEYDVQLNVEALDAILELFREQWSKGRAEGFVSGLEVAKATMLEHAGQLFSRNNDDSARFLRIFANETMTKQIAEAKKRTK